MNKEYQSELFEEFNKSDKKKHPDQGPPAARRYAFLLNVSYEQLVFFAIALIMLMVLVFSLGVERGKKGILVTKDEKSAVSVPKEPWIEDMSPKKQPEPKPKIAHPPQARPQPEKTVVSAPTPQQIDKVSKPYTIQVATYWSKENAKKELEALRKKGLDSFIISTNGKYEVCVGEYISKNDAAKSIEKLKKDYKDCFLRRR